VRPGLRWDLLAVVLGKEVLDNLRDRRALAMALFFPLLGPAILALSLTLLSQQARSVEERPLSLPVQAPERAPNLVAFLEERGVQVAPAPADPEAAVRGGEADVVLAIPEDHAARLREGKPAPVRLYLDASRTSARPAAERVRRLLDGYSHRIGVQRLLLRGVHPAVVTALAVEEVDLATAQSRAALLLAALPYFLVLALFTGGMAVAIDATAGERERQSLEPLLLHPVPRASVVLGKLLAAAVFGAVALAETIAGFGLVPLALPLERLGFAIRLEPAVLLQIFALLLPLLLLVAGVMILVAARARTFKAAQATLSFLMLVPALPGLVLAFVPVRLQTWQLLVPAWGEQLIVTRLIRGEAVAVSVQAIAMGSTAAWAVAVAWLAVRAFESEAFLFGRSG
jgi:sodium transport system permease protein